MNVDDLVLVSVDDHVVEPPDLFEGRLSKKHAEQAPKLVRKDDGTDVWAFLGQELPNIGLNAVAGRPKEEYAMDPQSFDDMRPGAYDIDLRIKEMDANGMLGSMCFPSFPQFTGQLFARTAQQDADLALALVQAYNDWHIDGWCGKYPGRFIPLAIPPLWDPNLIAAELERVAEKGCHAMTFSENVSELGHPSIHDAGGYWDPMFKTAEELGTVLCCHIGSSSKIVMTAPDSPMDVLITLSPINIVQAAADIVWSPAMKKFPKLVMALSEGGIGWVPYFRERIDATYDKHRFWTGQDMQGRLPSEVFDRQVALCYIEDASGLKNLADMNVDMVCWECDYPHADSTWPRSPETFLAEAEAANLDDATIDKITHLNAMRIFQYDPFSVIPREECTAGALRARAGDWDVSIQSRGIKASGTGAADLAKLSGLDRD